MVDSVIQPSFSAGELSPTLYARVDLSKYHVGLARMRNFFVDYRGGASNRTGTEFCARAKQSNARVRLIKFQFSTFQQYVLEFGDLYIRFYADGFPVLEPGINISAITNDNPALVTANAHGFSNGDTVYFAGVGGMTQINGITVLVSAATANTFIPTDLNGNTLSTLGFGVYTAGGTVSRVYTLISPYAAADLSILKYTQNADVMTITHPSYAARDLARVLHYQWTLTTIAVGAPIAAPGGLVTAASAGGTTNYSYVVTAVGNGGESIASTPVACLAAVDVSTTAGNIQVSWTAVVGATGYNVYKALPVDTSPVAAGATYGFAGRTDGNGSVIFYDTNIIPDFVTTPPIHTDPFAGSNYPGTVAYVQQRKAFAASTANPETLWTSRTGQYKNFDVSDPVQDDDAITATLVSKQVNAIRHMIEMPGGLLCLTSGGAWQVSGGSQSAAFTPASIQAVPQAYSGCSHVAPLIIGENILYVQVKGSLIRELNYSFYNNIYKTIDISVMSNHFFTGYEVTEWDYAEEPFKVVWAVRDDGHLLTMTYLKEQEVAGWAKSDTQGFFESVCVVQEGLEDVVYVVVRRFIDGQYLRYIERFASRQFPYGVEDAWFVDCGLTNQLTYPSANISASSSTGTIRVTADAAVFAPGDVGKVFRANGGIGDIITYISTTEVDVYLTQDMSKVIPDSDGMPYPIENGEWSMTAKQTTFRGLDHLEGKTVKVLGDGNVLDDRVVENGQITLSTACSKVIVGLKFTGQLQTLRLDTGDPTTQGKRKLITGITLRVNESRGLKVGRDFDNLEEIKERTDESYGSPTRLQSRDERTIPPTDWTEEGQVCIQQDDPLPATVLGIIPEVTPGDT